ncbi:MAG: ABC transporter permease, partial [Dorea sp.]
EDNGSGSDPGNIEDNGSISGSDNENTDDTSDDKDTDTNAITGSDSDTNTKVTVQSGTSGTSQVSADLRAPLTKELVAQLVPQLTSQDAIVTASEQIAAVMTEAVMKKEVMTEVGELTGELMNTMASAFHVNPDAIAGAFQFDLSEEELTRLMETMTSNGVEKNADSNLTTLGYQDLEEPTSISFYFKDFDSKELFVDFLDQYNEDMENEDEEKVIQYTDITGILMSSVSTIVNSVTYVLIAFVSISLIVSSIMIGIITYISVLERTKEIGVLRAIGASKKNISSIFNAETFIVGLCSGLLGVGVTSALVPPINYVIHTLTNNYDINAVLPLKAALVLVVLSIILTLISGLIPSKQAAKKDPVLALRSE